jgi:HK97 family phage portal protein
VNLLNRLLGGSRDISTLDDYAEMLNTFSYGGFDFPFGMTGGGTGVTQTLGGKSTEAAPHTFVGLAANGYMANGPVFSCMLVRMLVFSSIRFEWQRMREGKPSDTFANDRNLRILQRPWANGTTQDLLVRMIQDADLAGNAYITYDAEADELVRMRPDWMSILLEPRDIRGGPGQVGGGRIGWRKVGYLYTEQGLNSDYDPVFLAPNEVVHFMPQPDPLSNYRGMSWLTPIIREIRSDHAMTRFHQKYFDNGATPNMIVKYQPGTTLEKMKAFKELMDEGNSGVENAFKTLHLAPGADPVSVGSNMLQIDFKSLQGAGETRIAAAAGVPPVIAGFSEGLAAATYSNYSQARRRFADGTMHPLWENAAGSLESIMPRPGIKGGDDVRLWYDAKDVPFLREDEKDAAAIQNVEAQTINLLITSGYEADSIIAAIRAGDWRLLKHSGLMSVQLIKPGDLKPGSNKPSNALTGAKSLREFANNVDDDSLRELANYVETNGGSPNDQAN